MIKAFRIKERNRGKIKEALDTLPAGICYFSETGMVKLCNFQMLRLYYSIAQSDLQTLTELQTSLAECDEHTGILRIPGREQVYLFPDGNVWKYTERTVTAKDGHVYTEVLFFNITELYEKQCQLENQIQKLKKMSCKIKELSLNAVAAIKEREILEAKTRLHTQMSENLTMMRQTLFLRGPRKSQDTAVQAMKRTIQFLMADGEPDEKEIGFREFIQTAADCGVKVHMEGTMPSQQKIFEVFVIAMRECLTNAVCHGAADEMRIVLVQEDGKALCRVTNNGSLPVEGIQPQGGLKNLHYHVAACGGKMNISCIPEFTLTIMIPLEEEEKV